MGNLLTDMSISNGNSTWQVLSEAGVTDGDLHFLRRFRKGFAKEVAEAIKKGPLLHSTACLASDPVHSVAAVNQISDEDILADIYGSSQEVKVWEAVMERMIDEALIYHLVRLWHHEERTTARLIGARKLSRGYLELLGRDDGGYLPAQIVHRNDELVSQVQRERDAHHSEK